MEIAEESCFVLLVASIALLLSFYLYGRNSRRLPPGPRLNTFGLMYGRNGAESRDRILSMRGKYGDISCVRVLGVPCIYLNTYAKIRQFYQAHGDVMSGRAHLKGINRKMGAGRGVLLNDGLSWTDHRRFVLRTLRDFGFGRGGTEQIVISELQRLIELFKSHEGRAFDPQLAFHAFSCDVISLLAIGERCGSDPEFLALYGQIEKSLETTNTLHDSFTITLLKILTKLPTFMFKHVVKSLNDLQEFVERKVEEHRKKLNGQAHDLIDCYLQKLDELQLNSEAQLSSTFSLDELYSVVIDLYVAGMETTAATLRWALLLLVLHPDVQRRMQDEIDLVMRGRTPNSTDKKHMMYTDAVIHEIHRFVSLAPLGGIHHRCTQPVTIDQYEIPKNSMIYANFFAVHRDPEVWPDPTNFNPLNFYEETSNTLRNTENLFAFGIGRRACLGESLANQEIFLTITGLLQQFNFLAPDPSTFPGVDDCFFGNIRLPPSFELIMRPRTQSDLSQV